MKQFLDEYFSIITFFSIFITILVFGVYKYETSEYQILQNDINCQRQKNELLILKLKEQELKKKLEVEK